MGRVTSESGTVSRRFGFECLESRLTLDGASLFEQVAELVGEFGDGDDNGFGDSIATSGNWTVVGAPYDDRRGEDAGAAYLFEQVDGEWLSRGTLTAANGQAFDEFGWSVAIDQDLMVIGAQYDDEAAPGAGAVYVYELVNDEWTEVTKLKGEATLDAFGSKVAVEDRTIVVGAHWHGTSGSNLGGAVYVYEEVEGEFSEVFTMSRIPGTRRDNYLLGESVDISGDRIAVGAPGFYENGGAAGGAVIMLERAEEGWRYDELLVIPDGVIDDRFGEALALVGDTLVVGAPEKDYSATILEAGAAYIFKNESGSWSQSWKVTSDQPTGSGFFGREVAAGGGALHVLGWNDGTSESDWIGTVNTYRRQANGQFLLADQLTENDLGERKEIRSSMIANDSLFLIATFDYIEGNRIPKVFEFNVVDPNVPELPGDFNRDGSVDTADYAVWRNAMGQTGLEPYSGADGSGNGSVGQEDYAVWKKNFGESLPVGGGAAASFAANDSVSDERTEPIRVFSSAGPEVEQQPLVQRVLAARETRTRWVLLPTGRSETPRALEIESNRLRVDTRVADAALSVWFASRREERRLVTFKSPLELEGRAPTEFEASADGVFERLGELADGELLR